MDLGSLRPCSVCRKSLECIADSWQRETFVFMSIFRQFTTIYLDAYDNISHESLSCCNKPTKTVESRRLMSSTDKIVEMRYKSATTVARERLHYYKCPCTVRGCWGLKARFGKRGIEVQNSKPKLVEDASLPVPVTLC